MQEGELLQGIIHFSGGTKKSEPFLENSLDPSDPTLKTKYSQVHILTHKTVTTTVGSSPQQQVFPRVWASVSLPGWWWTRGVRQWGRRTDAVPASLLSEDSVQLWGLGSADSLQTHLSFCALLGWPLAHDRAMQRHKGLAMSAYCAIRLRGIDFARSALWSAETQTRFLPFSFYTTVP